MSTLIIYHGGCPDGFGSAYMFGQWLDQTTRHEKLAAQHSDEPPDVTDRDVVMLDFVYDDPQKVWNITQQAKSLLILDHHQTAWGVLDGLAEISLHDNIADGLGSYGDGLRTAVVNRDGTRSGVGLVADWISAMDPSATIPWWARYVQDRDLWKFELPLTRPVMAGITARPYTVEAWDDITFNMGNVIQGGQAIEQFRETLIDDAVQRAWVIDADWGEMLVTSCPYTIGSDAAGRLAALSAGNVGAYLVFDRQPGVKVGLRSTDDGPDVAELAAKWGGGGHRHAAGFRTSAILAWLP